MSIRLDSSPLKAPSSKDAGGIDSPVLNDPRSVAQYIEKVTAAHATECAEAVRLHSERLEDYLANTMVDGVIDAMLDQSGESHHQAKLAAVFSRRHIRKHFEIAADAAVLREFITPSIDAAQKKVAELMRTLHAVYVGHFEDQIVPIMRDKFDKALSHERSVKTTMLSDRVQFLEAHYNTETENLRDHAATLSEQLLRFSNAPKGAGDSSSNHMAYESRPLSQQPEFEQSASPFGTPQNMSLRAASPPPQRNLFNESMMNKSVTVSAADQIKRLTKSLADAIAREGRATAEVDRLTKILGQQQEQDVIFRDTLQRRQAKLIDEAVADHAEQIRDLKDRLSTVTTNFQEAAFDRDTAIKIARHLDDLAAKLNLQITLLLKIAYENGFQSHEFSLTEHQLHAMQYTTAAKEPLAVSGGWPAGAIPVLPDLKTDLHTVPPPATLQKQAEVLRSTVAHVDTRIALKASEEANRKLDATVKSLRMQMKEQAAAHDRSARELRCTLAVQRDAAMKEVAQLRHELAEAVVPPTQVVTSGPVVDDLVRRLHAAESRRKNELADKAVYGSANNPSIPAKEDAEESAAAKAATASAGPAKPDIATIVPGSIQMDDRILAHVEARHRRIYGNADDSTLLHMPHASVTPRARQLHSAYCTIRGKVVKPKNPLTPRPPCAKSMPAKK